MLCLFFLFNIFHYFLIRLKRVPTKGFICSSNITLSFGRYRANPTFCLTLSIPRKKTVPTNGFIRLSNIHRFVWSVWSEPDVLPYAFDTSEAWVFCRGERMRRYITNSVRFEFNFLLNSVRAQNQLLLTPCERKINYYSLRASAKSTITHSVRAQNQPLLTPCERKINYYSLRANAEIGAELRF